MDFAAFIPSVVAGALAGLFFTRASFWKRRYKDEQERHVSLARQCVLDRANHNNILREYEEALKQAQQAQLRSQKIGIVGVAGQSASIGANMDDEIRRLLTTHVIEEEP